MMMFQTLARVMLSHADALKAECEACRHRASWARAEAFAVFGSDATPPDIRNRLRCSACGGGRRARVWI